MSILFSSTALFTAARICAWLRETDGSSTIFAGVTAAVTTRFSLTAGGGSVGGAFRGPGGWRGRSGRHARSQHVVMGCDGDRELFDQHAQFADLADHRLNAVGA